MITMRQGRPEDYAGLQNVLQACGMCGEMSTDYCLVAFEEKSPVGLARLEFGEGIPHVRPIAVLPQWQGQSIGTRLLRIVITIFPEVRVVARGHATGFYGNLGFEPLTWEETYPPFRQDCEQCPDRAECNPCPMRYEAASDRRG
jgi:N-acetylglutamate synthase-like GNAT family acetyltransferase